MFCSRCTRIYTACAQAGKNATNQQVLGFSASTFFLFCIAEVIGAVLSGSLSLLGDAAAMSVDVFAYLCDMWAEKIKSRHPGELSPGYKLLLQAKTTLHAAAPCLCGVAQNP